MKKLLPPALFLILFLSAPAFAAQAQTEPRGFNYNLSQFTLTYQDKKFVIDSNTLTDWQGLTQWFGNSPLQESRDSLTADLASFVGLPSSVEPQDFRLYHYNLNKIYNYLQNNISTSTDQSVIEPNLVITDNRVTTFTPPQDGYTLDIYQSALNIAEALEQDQDSAALAVSHLTPSKTLGDTNNLGIKELIAEGTSGFKGSPNNRRHNIAVGLEKFKGLLIAPGQEFSFDDNLGPVTADAGFLPELVIDNGNTLPELGGGLCQVSTTTFRAAMAAGLPITDRRNHAYAVSYYSPQGTDATIYPGSADLKFINNTPGDILIWPYEKDPNTLIFDFYGTNDGRQVTLEKPVVYDRQTDGSMKATWTRVVTGADGQTATSTFKSTYQPPALFHKTEEFVSATGTPSSGLQMSTKPQ